MEVAKKVVFIKDWILNYVNSMPVKAQSLVIGISGGIDSSVTSTLCAMTGLKTIVLTMPIKQNKEQNDLSLLHKKWLSEKFNNVEIDSPIIKDDSTHRCSNSSCPAVFLESIRHFVSKNALDIEGLGEKWCASLISNNMIQRLSDIYKLNISELSTLDRMGEVLASKLVANIEDSKSRPLDRVIFGLGILHVGSEIATLLAQTYGSLQNSTILLSV